ncbi:MAG TPA: thymidine kinase [Candidatus Saccharimonadales bacterium]|nr:thymidine kinase [Candidatus Saccharimonadales bacterium]
MERLIGIAGCMFSGKSEELLRRVVRSEIAGNNVLVFKPQIDDRWGKKDSVRSHAGSEHTAIRVEDPKDILKFINGSTDIDMVAIDEIQFMGPEIIPVINELLEANIKVCFAGLPLDFRGEPFGQMPTLLTLADDIARLTAICTYKDNGEICGEDATRTQRLVNGEPAKYTDEIILIGAKEAYAPRCPNHHIVPGKPRPMLK